MYFDLSIGGYPGMPLALSPQRVAISLPRGLKLNTLVTKQSLRSMSASESMRLSSNPAEPTKGLRSRSSASPQASPTIAIFISSPRYRSNAGRGLGSGPIFHHG